MSTTVRIRVRGPQGVTTLAIPSDTTWSSLVQEISAKTSVPDFDLKYGYPPQNLETHTIATDTKLSDLPQNLNGEQLTVVPRVREAEKETNTPAAQSSIPPAPQNTGSDYPSQPLNLSRKAQPAVDSDPPEVPVPSLDGVLTLRIMPDDNSCLFRALSSALLGPNLDSMTELRSIVAQTIQTNPELYTAGVLEKEPDAYCKWIQNPDSWGGGIELSILSQHFDVEICSVNVQDLRIDRFNEGTTATRCIVVYSGIHYDVVAVTPYSGADPEFDRKVFDVVRVEGGEEMDGGALDAAVRLCGVLKERHYFTDTHAFSLKCNQCGEGGNGQAWAVQHAKATGHGDFGEG